jgi:hypothetical protein
MERFYVIPFTNKEYRDFGKKEFALRVHTVPLESMLKLRRQPQLERNVLVMKGYLYQPPPKRSDSIEEYVGYSVILFFNEGCMRMYQDIGLDLKVLKVITEEELPMNLESAISGSYLPKR